MKIYNLQLALLKNLYSSKENRLVFDETPGASPAVAAEKPASAPQPNPEDKELAEIKELTPEKLKAKIKDKIITLKAQVEEVMLNTKAEYSEKLQAGVQQFEVPLVKLETDLNAIEVNADADKSKLTGIYGATRQIEQNVSKDILRGDRNLVVLKKAIDAKQGELTPELVAAEITEKAGAQEVTFSTEDIQALYLFMETYFNSLQDRADSIKPADLEKEIPAIQGVVEQLNADQMAEAYLTLITTDQGKRVIVNINELSKVEAKSPEAQKLKAEALVDFMGSVLGGQADSVTPELIAQAKARIEAAESAGIDAAAYAKVAEILNDPEITAEDIAAAITTYKPGKYENGQESAKYKKIIEKIIAAKPHLLDAGIHIDLLGGTDGLRHGLIKDKGWHKDKATAFTKLLELQDAGNLHGIVVNPAQRSVIEPYIAAANAGKGYEFIRDNTYQESFLRGRGYFDMALALQRAEKASKEIYNESINAKTPVFLEIGANQDDVNQRKSGIKLSMEEENSVINGPETITMTKAELDDLLGPIRRWNKNPDHPSQKGQGLETDPGECSEDGKTGRNYKGPGDKDYDYYQKGDDGVWKKIVLEAAEATETRAVYEEIPMTPALREQIIAVPTWTALAAPNANQEYAPNDTFRRVKKEDGTFKYYRNEGGTWKSINENSAIKTPELQAQIEGIKDWKKSDDPEAAKFDYNQDETIAREQTSDGKFVYWKKEADGWKKVLAESTYTGINNLGTAGPSLTANTLDSRAATKEVQSDKDHIYSLSKDGKILNVLFKGEKEATSYKLVIPEELTVKLETDSEGNLVRINSKDGALSGFFNFNTDKKFEAGGIKGKVTLLKSYKINLDGNTINVVAKTADELAAAAKEQAEATKADLLKQINDLELNFNGVLAYETGARTQFVDEIMAMAKAVGKTPGPDFIQRMGFEKGKKVNYSVGAGKNTEVSAKILDTLKGEETTPAPASEAEKVDADEFTVEALTQRWKNEETKYLISFSPPRVGIKFGKNETPVIFGIKALAPYVAEDGLFCRKVMSQDGGYGVNFSLKYKGVPFGVRIQKSGIVMLEPDSPFWKTHIAELEDGEITIRSREESPESIAAAKADLMKQIDDLELDFNGVFHFKNGARTQFVDEIMAMAKAVGKTPGPDFIQRMGFEKGKKVNYSVGAGKNTEVSAKILATLKGGETTPAPAPGPAAPAPTGAPESTPSPELDAAQLEDKLDEENAKLAKKYDIVGLKFWRDVDYDYKDILGNLDNIDKALAIVQKSHSQDFLKLKNVGILLNGQSLLGNIMREGSAENDKGQNRIAIDYNETPEDIAEDIIDGISKMP